MKRSFFSLLAGGLLLVIVEDGGWAAKETKTPDSPKEQRFVLADDSVITGALVHYFDGMMTIQLADTSLSKIPLEKIKRVEFALPTPRAEFSTPEKSLNRLIKAATEGKLEQYVEGHSTYYQMLLNHQLLSMGPDKFSEDMKREWSGVKIDAKQKASIRGELAILKVIREANGERQEGEFRFVRENKEWKMILPL